MTLTTTHLLLDLCSQLSEQILKGFVFGLQLSTPLSIQKGLVKPTEFLESLSSPKPGFHITWVIIKSWKKKKSFRNHMFSIACTYMQILS